MNRAEVVVDVAAIRHNVRALRRWAGSGTAFMAVVKADGYGHGLAEAARAAREGGADWLGVATLDEARALRATGDAGRVLTWLAVPGEAWDDVLAADVDVTASSPEQLDEVAAAAARVGRPARVQLKVDTGLSRGGATGAQWPALVQRAVRGEAEGSWRVTGLWSHLASSDRPDDPANAAQEQALADAVRAAEQAGLRPEVRHLANSAATVLRPGARLDLVRCGLACYGLDPAPGHLPAALDLRPALSVRTRLALVKAVPAGASVSYGGTWTAPADTVLGLVPVGYAEGLPRAAGNRVALGVAGARRPVRGVICMDQLVVDLGAGSDVAPGAQVDVLGGTGPSAQEWAEAAGTISYEVVTRLGGRLVRRHVDSERDSEQGSEQASEQDSDRDEREAAS